MREKSRAWLLATPILVLSLQGTGVASAGRQSDPWSGSRATGDLTPTLLGKTWELDLKAEGCGPPLGVDVGDLGMGIVRRTLVFGDQGMLRQQDTISPGNEVKNLLEAAFEVTGDTVNIRWKPEDREVDSYKIAGLTDKSVTLAAYVNTCRYRSTQEAPPTSVPGTPAPGTPTPETSAPESPAPETPTP